MESHKGIRLGIIIYSLYPLLIHIGRNGIVDIQQGYLILRCADSNILGKRSPDVRLTGNRDPFFHQPGINIAWNKFKFRLEGRPAFVRHCHIVPMALMAFDPVLQRYLILCELFKDFRNFIGASQLFCHLLCHRVNPFILRMCIKGCEEIQLRVFLNLHSQFIQTLDWRVAGQKILRPRPEGDEF